MFYLFLSVLLFSLLKIGSADEIDICKENDGNPRIKVGLRINDYTVLISTNEKVYRIENFKFDGKDFKFGIIEDLTKEWITDDKEEMYVFPMQYLKGSSQIRIIHIRKEITENLEQLFSYQTLHSKDLKTVISEDRFSLLIYKYKPEPTDSPLYDPLTLMTLFAKFPSDSILDNLKTIMAFPLNKADLPNRFFVYYLEMPTKQQLKVGNTETKFKRHIMIGKRLYYGSNATEDADARDSEIDWQHDINSGKCLEEETVVNASFAITDYTQVNQRFQFEIIEFSGDLYFVKRVQLDHNRVDKDLQVLKVGVIGSIFGCNTSATVPTTGPPPREHTPVHKVESKVLPVMMWMANIALLLVLIVICLMVYGILNPDHPFH